MICTGSYENCKAGNLISISGDGGKSANFTGKVYSKLAPKKEFWNVWRDNIGKVSEEENNTFYIHEFYNTVLRNLNPVQVSMELGEAPILLCYEKPGEFCHRHIVSSWLERSICTYSPEVIATKSYFVTIIPYDNSWIDNIVQNLMENDSGKRFIF